MIVSGGGFLVDAHDIFICPLYKHKAFVSAQ
jgi:hypothetical protein